MRKKKKKKKNEAKANTRLGSSYLNIQSPSLAQPDHPDPLPTVSRGTWGTELVARDWLFLNSRLNDRNA